MATSSETPDAFAMASGVPAMDGQLRPPPPAADRISKKIIGVGFLVVALIGSIFFISLSFMEDKPTVAANSEKPGERRPAAGTTEQAVPKELTDPQDGDGTKRTATPASLVKSNTAEPTAAAQSNIPAGAIPAGTGGDKTNNTSADPNKVPKLGGTGGDMSKGGLIPKDMGADSSDAGRGYQQPPPKTTEQMAEDAAKMQRDKRLTDARSKGLSVKAYGGDDRPAGPGSPASAALNSLLAAAQQGQGATGGMQPVGLPAPPRGDSEQDEKLDFIKNANKDDIGYHKHVPMAAISKNEVKRGAWIPMRLEQGINTSQPGQITARVTEDVYDTITGCRLLIPALTTVIGKYDSKIAVGQDRVLALWSSMTFENGDELNLAGMQGYDAYGAAGLQSEVDNHYLRLFGLTFGMSMVTTGVQMSVPQSSSTTTVQTPQQQLGTALAQQYGQLGAQILGKYMAVQPTLTNNPGERFNIMVPNTIVLKKVWRRRC